MKTWGFKCMSFLMTTEVMRVGREGHTKMLWMWDICQNITDVTVFEKEALKGGALTSMLEKENETQKYYLIYPAR